MPPNICTISDEDLVRRYEEVSQNTVIALAQDLGVARSTLYKLVSEARARLAEKEKGAQETKPLSPNDHPPEEPGGVASCDDTRSSTTETNETNEERE